MRPTFCMLAFGALLSMHHLAAQQPAVMHAQLSTLPANQGLAAQIDTVKRTGAPTWVAWQIPVAEGFHSGANTGRVTFLENGNENGNEYEDHAPYTDAAFDHLDILMRVADGGIGKLRLENPDRQLDAGGLPFVWFTGVAPADSIRLLQSVAQDSGSAKLRNDAVFFISVHRSPEATPALVQLTSPGNDPKLREKAAFWLANQRGHEGFLAIQRLARQDADPRFREKLAFDLTLCHEPPALEELIRMAQQDASPQVRRQAQFWMANAGGRKIAAELRNSTERDPDAEVRKSAVFALSSLPGDEAAAQLIQVAKTSSDPAVRRQAVFWLGQSQDPRAFDYLAQLLRQ